MHCSASSRKDWIWDFGFCSLRVEGFFELDPEPLPLSPRPAMKLLEATDFVKLCEIR